MSARTLLRGGLVLDGSGAGPRPGDVLIEGDRIAAVGAFETPAEARILECAGMAVAPGFIDAHSHSDLQVLGRHPEKLRQGVTAEVVGNCGFSAYPMGGHGPELREFANGILHGSGEWGWDSARAYLDGVRRQAELSDVFSLVGHGSLRVAVAGLVAGPLTEPEVARMEALLDEALAEGAVGMSTGLMYAPGSSAPAEELERLCRVVARRGKVYTTHMRDYGRRLLEAIDEQVGLAQSTGCRLQISHLQAVGRQNWALNQRALERIEQARAAGIDIAFDCYPYVAGSTVLTQWLPQWALAGGIDALVARLTDPQERRRVREETLAELVHEWSDLRISSIGSAGRQRYVGWTLEAVAEEWGREPVEVVFDLLIAERGIVNILEFNQSEENLRANLAHPLSILISDGFYVSGRPHPRLHGTFPEILGLMARDRGWLTLAQAVHKITGAPAARFGLRDKGLLRPGYAADVTVFDPGTVASRATYDDPEQAPVGITLVMRQGKILFQSRDRTL